MTVFPGPELADALWTAEVMARAEAITSTADPHFDRLVGKVVADILNEASRGPQRRGRTNGLLAAIRAA